MIAIQLTSSGSWLDLPTDISLRYEMLFPAFDFEFIQANAVYPFEFPIAGNEEKFNHANVISVNRTTRVYAVSFYIGGLLLFSGNLYLKNVNKTTFSASIVENKFIIPLSETSIKQLGWEDITASILETIAYDAIYKTWPEVKINFPMLSAPSCYGENNSSNETFAGFVNNYNAGGHFWEPNTNIVDELPPENVNAMAPLPYLFSVIEQIESFFNVSIIGSFLDIADYKKILIFNQLLADKGDSPYYCALFQLATTIKYYPAQGLINDPLLEDWILWLLVNQDENSLWNGYRYDIQERGYHNIKATMVVDWTEQEAGIDQCILWVRKGDAEPIGYALEVGDDGHAEINYEVDFYAYNADVNKPLYFALCIENNSGWFRPNTIVSNFEITNRTTSARNVFDNTINIGNYLPDINVTTVLNQLRLLTGSAVFVNENFKQIEISSLDSILDSDSIDLTNCIVSESAQLECLDEDYFHLQWDWAGNTRESVDISQFRVLPEVVLFSSLPNGVYSGDICYVSSEKSWYAHYFNTLPNTWKNIKDGFEDYLIGAGKTTINAGLSPVRITNVDGNIYPVMNSALISKLFNTGSETSNLHLLLWHGMCPNSDGENYPFASSGSYDTQGNEVSDIELDWNGEKGFYERCWKRWVQFVQTQETLTQQLRVDLSTFIDIQKLFLPQNGNKKTRQIRLASINYIPEKISVIFTNADTWECEAILRKKGYIEL